MNAVLFVRIQSNLSPEEIEQRVQERKPAFLEVPGLQQKIVGREPETGDICGIYFFVSEEALDAYRTSELGASIAKSYEAIEVRKEGFD